LIEVPTRSPGYLERLTVRLARGLASSSPEFVQRHRAFLTARQGSDGGWPGREGGSDLYYTAFALRGLAITAGLTGPALAGTAQFLKSQLTRAVSVVDFMSLLYATRLIEVAGGQNIFSEHAVAWPARVAATLESFRRPDGGYAKAIDGTSGSTYHTFLVALCYELIGLPMPDRQRVVDFVRSRRRDDGGYVEVSAARRGGTNPTAAAVAILIMLDALDAGTRTNVSGFLIPMQSPEGGLRANDRAPMADLLSTFTGMLTLADLDATGRIDSNAVRRFIDSIEAPSGGFHGGVWDQATDVEYTFYGLATVALLNESPTFVR
jgi:geranylgeranyl transferase type-2 subunit beta